ncbi:MAG: nitroreductase [Alphaproteobacteria bacterium]|nr:MAG: nitroreductase [Alphaproteobacteria bacterium]
MTSRQADYSIHPLFLERWSPRAFDGAELSDANLFSMFEAARWAPSAFNSQPWHFVYAKRGDDDWERFLSLLIPFNKGWAHTASALVYIVSDTLPFTDRKTGEPAPSTTHSFDAGAAWACLALQATRMGYHAHGMSGIQYELARAELGLPKRYQLDAACVIGRIGDPAQLDEKQRAREFPSGRKAQEEFVHRGGWSS